MPYGKVKKDEKETVKLTNFPRNHNVLVLFSQLRYLNNIDDTDFQRELISMIKINGNLQRYLLASGKIGQHLQEEIDLQVTDDRCTC